ncbi:hypothetical protein Agub_g5434, partial [Astrephomene gubernaculifera]
GSLQQQRSRSCIQVPSRTCSHPGAEDSSTSAAGPSAGGSRIGLAGQPSDPLGGSGWGDDSAGGAPPSASAASASGRSGMQPYRRIPSNHQMAPGEGAPVHGVFHEMDIYTPLSGHLPRLWQLWEMTLLGRALLLVAPTPGEASAGVAALLSLIAPLPYAPDFRPYYCIHDAAFGRLAAGVLPGPEARDVPTLMGVTNLYFLRALPHWPNILSIGKREAAAGAGGCGGGPGGASQSSFSGSSSAASAAGGSLAAAANMFRANAAVQALRQRTQGAAVLLSGHTEALWAAYKPLCRPDQALLQRLLQPKPGDVKSKVARIALVNSDAIRRHFSELTTAFLSPFNRYFEAEGGSGRVPGWNSSEFTFALRSGELAIPQQLLDRVGSPAAALELYARFTACLNFAAWFAARRRLLPPHLTAPLLP